MVYSEYELPKTAWTANEGYHNFKLEIEFHAPNNLKETKSFSLVYTHSTSSPVILKGGPLLLRYSHGGFINDPSQAMEFWKRHPKLESLKIIPRGSLPWNSKDLVFENFLPNLRYLEVLRNLQNNNTLSPITAGSLRRRAATCPHFGSNDQFDNIRNYQRAGSLSTSLGPS